MADQADKLPDNTPGAFYVDVQCIDCDLCRQSAPANFERNDAQGYSFVVKQPEDQDELDQCKTALEDCPVEAIGADG